MNVLFCHALRIFELPANQAGFIRLFPKRTNRFRTKRNRSQRSHPYSTWTRRKKHRQETSFPERNYFLSTAFVTKLQINAASRRVFTDAQICSHQPNTTLNQTQINRKINNCHFHIAKIAE